MAGITADQVLNILGSAVISGGGVWAYFARKVSPPADMAASNADLVTALATQTKILLDQGTQDRNTLVVRVDAQDGHITRLSKEVGDCKEHHAACEANVTSLRSEIDKLMAGPVATYPHEGAKG